MNKNAKSALKGALVAGAVAGAVTGAYWAGRKVEWFKNYCKLIPYEVKSVKNSNLTEDDDYVLVAHRGFRAVAPENTLPAYEEAGKAGYWGAECDTYMTKDGVWVVQHDSNIFRMMNLSFQLMRTFLSLITTTAIMLINTRTLKSALLRISSEPVQNTI